MGLNNKGARKIARRLARMDGRKNDRKGLVLGINLAKTHDPAIVGDAAVADFRESFRLLAPHADYVALNVSCPNTSEGKTFEDPSALEPLLQAIREERAAMAGHVPLLVKLSPSYSDRVVYDSAIEIILELSRRYDVDGFVATNTASDRENLESDESLLGAIGRGGLSGRPLEARSTHLVRYIHRQTGGELPNIGVGGIFSAEDAYRKILAGASLIQIYTGLVYEGPSLVDRIKRGLVELLEGDGFTCIGDAVGADA
jgi:dihydroorotate dehydrogenase